MRVPARMLGVVGLVLGLGLVPALAGCSGGAAPSHTGSPTAAPADAGPPAPGAACPGKVSAGQPVHFGNNGATNLGGVVWGTGPTGVVLAHQAEGSLCEWAGYAADLARRGYRVLAFDFPGYGYSSVSIIGEHLDAAVVAAVGYLRTQGVTKTVLIGASMGGTSVLVAAAAIQPPVAGVVSVSGPVFFQGVAALPAVKQLTVPVLYAVGRADEGFAEDAQTLYDATPATTDRKLLIVGAGLHGVDLVADGSEVEAAISAFLKAHAPV